MGLPASGYFSDAARTKGEMKTALDDQRDYIANKPTFNVGKGGAAQTLTTSTNTLITWSSEIWDSNNNFASNRFTPTIAGKYRLNVIIQFTSGVDGSLVNLKLYKNGGEVNFWKFYFTSTTAQTFIYTILVDANGSTDYFEVYALQASGSDKDIDGANPRTLFQGNKVAG